MNIPTRTISKPIEPLSQITEPAAELHAPEAEQKLISFCEKQIDKMNRYARINNDEGQIGFYELNCALAEYQSINLGLIAVYNFAKVEAVQAKEAFEDWYAEKYVVEREELNPRSLSAQKWLGAKEIEMHVRHKYKADYKKLNAELTFAEQKVALLRRLLDSWGNQHFILGRLSKNVEADIRGSYGNDANGSDLTDQ